jgi:hypothetical protein
MTTPIVQNSLLDPEIKKVLEAIIAVGAQGGVSGLKSTVIVDLNSLRSTIVSLNAKLDVLTAKMNADAGITDINYATNFAATLTPPAITTV